MFLSDATPRDGVLPGPIVFRKDMDLRAIAIQRARNAHRRFQLYGLGDDIAPVVITPPIDMSTGLPSTTYQVPGTSPGDFLQPVSITPPIDLSTGLPQRGYIPYGPGGVPGVAPSLPDFISPTSPTAVAPDFSIAPPAAITNPPQQYAANPVPTQATPDTSPSFLDVFQKAIFPTFQLAASTYLKSQAASRGLPPGISAGGITPGSPVSSQGAPTPSQWAAMTPQQRAQYQLMYPGTIPQSYSSIPAPATQQGDLLSQIFGGAGPGGMSSTTILVISGLSLVGFFLFMRSK